MKVGGGWHGAQPFLLKGISSYRKGLNQIESAGIPPEIESTIVVCKYNDLEDLEQKFRYYGDKIACFILEPMVGTGGLIFGNPEYIKLARELTDKFGALLIMDEVISGFRFHAGGLHTLIKIKPDLCILGKCIGGGMPVSAVAGREDIISLCAPDAPFDQKVKFDGGTFSGHPASILAGLTFISYLIEHENEIYKRIGLFGRDIRKGIEEIFANYGLPVRCSGAGDPITENSSFIGVHFLNEEIDQITSPDEAWNPELCDIELREEVFKLAMLEEGFFTYHGFGAVSAAHSESDVQASLDAVDRIAIKWGR
jgi:glutamate-1-semialdehyde 2,1-aminomutase